MSIVEKFTPKYNFNIKQTRNEYSKINNLALRGLEVATYDHNTKEVVSHLKKPILDYLLSRVTFSVDEIYDDKLQSWTISVPEIDLYGEGTTKERALSDLISSIQEYIELYSENDLLSKHESPEKQAAIIKLMRCDDAEAMRKTLGV